MTELEVAPDRVRSGSPVVLLDPYAARSCPVKTQNAYDPTVTVLPGAPDERLAELFDGGLAHRAAVLDAWAAVPGVIDLRDTPRWGRETATAAALRRGAAVVIGPLLPADPVGHRTGSPAALVRGADRPDGGPRYHPVEVKWHRAAERRPAAEGAAPTVLPCGTLARSAPAAAVGVPGYGPRVSGREGAFLQLAHAHRGLQALGVAGDDDARAALVGTDTIEEVDGPVLVWVDLAEPLVRTFSRSSPEGWRVRSLLERYDHEHGFRVAIADRAARQTGHPDDPPRLVRPIVVPECSRCPWWEQCRPQLDADDLGLQIRTGRLDVREIATLRRHGVATLTDLLGADLEALLPRYLPEVTHRPGAETRLRTAARRARMLLDGVAFDRVTDGPIPVPAAEVEVDFDLETSADGRVYLWGFRVQPVDGPARYHWFGRFADLDDPAELALAREALGWLRDLAGGGSSVRVYHYSEFEPRRLAALADLARRTTGPDPVLDWAEAFAETGFVDLLTVVKEHFFGVSGLGLKAIARQAGFAWRDEDPGGLNSQRWFLDAVHADTAGAREQARRRVLAYNEDDVIATARLRAWLREQ